PKSYFQFSKFHNTTLFLLPFLYSLLFLTGLPGNAMSLWVFLRCISNKTSTHVYLSNLSLSNLLLSFTTPFLAAYYAQGSVWLQSSFMCQLVLHSVTPLLHINIYIGVTILTWVALSRFATIIQHTHAARQSACTTLLPASFFACLRKASIAYRVCAAVWVLAVGCIVPVTVYYSVKEAARGNEVVADVVCYNPAVEIGGGLSTASCVPAITIFFICFLLVLLSYVTVLRHIRRSSRSTNIATSHSLLGRVIRNILVIQVVLAVCLLPHHVFKPIFISLVLQQLAHPDVFFPILQVKNCLLFLAALRGSTDPVVYFLLDKTFRSHTLSLFGRHSNTCSSSESSSRREPGEKNSNQEQETVRGREE
uniref:G protein-coupled receptor 82 n=1 Tax=Myripristis murdjan TaxID=586833 RepID=A0A668AVN1_9TELE